MTGPLGTVNFVSLESQCFPRRRLGKHWRFSGNKIDCSPRDQQLSVYGCISQGLGATDLTNLIG